MLHQSSSRSHTQFMHMRVPQKNLVPTYKVCLNVLTSQPATVGNSYRIAGYFQRVFIFRYFEEAFFRKNKSPGPTVFEKIFSRLNKMLVCTHLITLSLQHECVLQLCRYFKRLPDQKARNPKHCPQLLMRLLMKLCMLATHHFETTEGVS